jgi:hypothetical protein
MASRKAQSKAGVAATRRGQQMGDARSTNTPAKQEQSKAATPSARGQRKDANKFFADNSAQQPGSNDDAAPRSNSPSTPAALPAGKKLGESGGEKVFKQQAKKRGTK